MAESVLFDRDVVFTDEFSALLRISLMGSHPDVLGLSTPATKKVQAPPASGSKAKGRSKQKAKTPPASAKSEPAREPTAADYFAEITPETYTRHKLRPAEEVDYGMPPVPSVAEAGKFYITTAINYTNGYPHMGHAYEGLCADILARYHRIYGRSVFFLTGSDEHGQKIAKTAEKEGVEPIVICDRYAEAFQALNQRLCVKQDRYVRTTDEFHMQTCRRLWQLCADCVSDAGESDIYLNAYEGWYNEREETFVSDTDAKAANYVDATSGLPLTKMAEESYFFRMSRYQERLLQHIQAHPEFIQPEDKRVEILERLQEPLRDLCVSRTTFDWGIPVPEGFKANHVMYVWFDALTNYLTGVEEEGSELSKNARWPADVHVIGKDIIWFHTVIWPCMLMSANLDLPKSVFAHGFISGADGRKMSKSIGNVVDPHDVLDYISADTFRWYMATEAQFGRDLNFSIAALILKHNADLSHSLGNLVNRATSLCISTCGGQIPPEEYGAAIDVCLPFGFELIAEAEVLMETHNFSGVAELAISSMRLLNQFITTKEPWKMKDNPPLRSAVIRAVVEGVWFLAHFFEPFIPLGAKRIFDKIQYPPQPLASFMKDGKFEGPIENIIPSGTPIVKGEILYAVLTNAVQNPKSEQGKAKPSKKGKGKANGVEKG